MLPHAAVCCRWRNRWGRRRPHTLTYAYADVCCRTLPLAEQVGAQMAKGGAAFEKNRGAGSMEQKLIKMRAVLSLLALLVHKYKY